MIEIIEQKHFYSSPSYTSKQLPVAQYENLTYQKIIKIHFSNESLTLRNFLYDIEKLDTRRDLVSETNS